MREIEKWLAMLEILANIFWRSACSSINHHRRVACLFIFYNRVKYYWLNVSWFCRKRELKHFRGPSLMGRLSKSSSLIPMVSFYNGSVLSRGLTQKFRIFMYFKMSVFICLDCWWIPFIQHSNWNSLHLGI